MAERWYKEAVIYSLQVDAFADSDGDGCGDLRGLISRLDYLSRLGVTCLWLNPIHPSPLRDNGYDVTDYYGVHPRLGTLGDFAELTQQGRQRGIRVVLDLVVNHTSDEPPDRNQGMVFPGEQEETWSFSERAGAWYYHRFYGFQPDLNWSNPAVRAEISKVMGFWLQLGVAGFRVDAAPFILEQKAPGVAKPPMDFGILDDWRADLQWRAADAILLCEANVEATDVHKYTGERVEGPNTRAHMMFSFGLNPKLWLGLARQQAEPVIEALQTLPALQPMAAWATFLRNHDELDLSKLTADQRAQVFDRFGPEKSMRIYDRGIRRRLAPMLRGNRRQIELAYALQFSMPGTPVLRYGEELGMGEDLSLDGRESIRTPMQWDDGPNAGFSDAEPALLVRPVVDRGKFSYRKLNVRQQQRDPDSLLRWFGQLIATLRECPEIGVGTCTTIDVPLPPSVLAHRFDAPEGSILLLHNLADRPVTVDIGRLDGTERPWEMLADAPYPRPTATLKGLTLGGWGYRWIRLRRGRAE